MPTADLATKKGTSTYALYKHMDELQKLKTKKDAIDFLVKLRPEINSTKHFNSMLMKLNKTRSDTDAITYLYNSALDGSKEGLDKPLSDVIAKMEESKCKKSKKKMNESSDFNTRQIIREKLGYSVPNSMLELFEDVIDRIDNIDDEDEVIDAIDSSIMYNDDINTLNSYYRSGKLQDGVYEEFLNDVETIVSAITSDDANESLKEGYEDNPFSNLRSNILEFPNGEYMYIGFDHCSNSNNSDEYCGTMYAGSAVGGNIAHEFELEYSPDDSVDDNIQALYDTIIEQRPELMSTENESLKESKKTNNTKKLEESFKHDDSMKWFE